MFAPVVSRFTTYGIDPEVHGDKNGTAARYMETVWKLDGMAEWGKASEA